MAEQPVSVHVYRHGWLLSDSRIVKSADKTTILYFLHGFRTSSYWDLTLHAGGVRGPGVCRIHKTHGGIQFDEALMPFVITMLSDGWTTRLERRRGYFDGTYWFKGPDNNEYRWKWRSSWSWRNDLLCVNAHNDMIAAYRVTTMAIAKDGELRIYPAGQFMSDLLVATTLAMRTPQQ